ncbi:MAG: MmcQ/YjbR family DNA-binding protein [Halioglobus sp.]|nr:MmcQ/YjbR family DNA-binding protein [Halioglobus sp.]
MKYAGARKYLLHKPEAFEDFPFGPDVAVMKVCGRMFATLSREKGIANMNLKCEPAEALILRDIFPAVLPGYHMNKTHWNTVVLDGSIPQGEIERMIDNSYALVVRKLPAGPRRGLEARNGSQALYG